MGFRAAATIADFVPVLNPGQLGAAATEDAHRAQAAPVPEAPTPGHDQATAAHEPGGRRRGLALRGGRALFEVRPEHAFTSVNGAWTGHELAGAPVDATQTQEHTPPARLRSWLFLRRKDRGAAPYLGRGEYTDPLDDRQQSEATPAESNTYQQRDDRRGLFATITPANLSTQAEVVESDPSSPVVRNPEPRQPRPDSGVVIGEGRPATVPRWNFYRAYGHHQAEQLTGARGVLGAPGVSMPTQTTAEAPGKQPAPGMRPVLVPHPNTWRTNPTPWDTDIIDNGAGRRAATGGWRAR